MPHRKLLRSHLSLHAARCAALVVTLCLVTGLSLAADPISTDRPDFVESSLVVGAGRVQIETSLSTEHADGFGRHSARTLATPTLLRIGLSDLWEARLETEGYTQARSARDAQGQQPTERGFSDLALGLKVHLATPGFAEASSALLLHADLPSGHTAFRGRGVRPSLRYVAEWELPQDCALGVMPGVIDDTDDQGRRFLAGIAGVTVSHAWTAQARSFAELAAESLFAGSHAETQLRFDTGAAFLLGPDLQLDAAAYIGLNPHTPDLTLSLGLSHRW